MRGLAASHCYEVCDGDVVVRLGQTVIIIGAVSAVVSA